MSFWSWIGLADKRDISALQSEISFLREENQKFQEQNCKLLECIEEVCKDKFDILVSGISEVREQNEERFSVVDQHIEQLVGSVTDSKTVIANLKIEANTKIDECVRMFDSSNRVIKEMLDGMQSEFKTEYDDIQKKIDDNANLLKVLDEKANNIDSMQESLFSLAESIKYLWTIMKAVWVDSVLEDIDSVQ